MSRVEIKGEQHSVAEVFSERYAFVVPPYQRPYAWTTEHAGELLEDLITALGEGDEPIDDLNPYFLGSIVLVKGTRPEAQIVDGQQRLITLTILLAVLRSLIPGEMSAGITRRLYEPADPLNNVPARYRVRPKERDADFFQTYIQNEDGLRRLRGQVHNHLSGSQRNMRENADLYLRETAQLSEPRRVRLAQFVVQRCLMIAVATPDLESAYRIFTVLNDRGLDLTTADLLKAEIIGHIPPQEQAEYVGRWEQTEESLGAKGFNDLLADIRAIHKRYYQRNSILDDIRTAVLEPLGDARRVVDDVIVPFGAASYTIRNAVYEHANVEAAITVNSMLRWLDKIDNADWIPPALLYLSRYPDQPDRLARFFTELERLAASLMIRRQYANKRETRYQHLLVAIERGEDLSKPDSPIQLTPEEREATLAAMSGDLYLMPVSPRNYALWRLDNLLAGAGATYDRRQMTVEHVLPRNPSVGSQWLQWFPTTEVRAQYANRLGNLVLLSRSKNAQASNYDFETKKRKYFGARGGISPFALTTQVLQESVWTPDVVQRRQDQLVARLKELWRL
ncbi:MAG TPA: DUF262 domain-containing HNH endonuclease family protein [Ktedonobacterales bacterium]|jgi:hypothetical protein